ncbi:MAG: hypothetical protein AB1403_20180 [Candidatus Riflebacteria bacterium]
MTISRPREIKTIVFILIWIVMWAIPLHAQKPVEKVEVGLYLLDVAHLDVKESEFFADFYIWYKVASESAWEPKFIEFMNGTIDKATDITPSENKLNKKYWVQRIKGRFRGHFRLHSYPFDRQTLPIAIEDSENNSHELVFVPDPDIASSAMNWVEPELVVPDWNKESASFTVDVHHYRTDFGLGNQEESDYSRFSFRLVLSRTFVPHLIKFILPLIIIAGMAYMVFFINASEFETQCGICVTALLSAVALHISQADALPAVGYLVMSDKIFILFYVVIFSALVQTVVNNSFAKKKRIDVAIKLDDFFKVAYVVILVIGAIMIYGFS